MSEKQERCIYAWDGSKILLEADIPAFALPSSSKELPKQWKEQVFQEIRSWNPEKVSFYQDTLTNNSTLGDRRVIDTDSNLEYSQSASLLSDSPKD